MSKTFILISLLSLGATANATIDGSILFNKNCKQCHGVSAERVYLNKIPALKTLDSQERFQYMKEYAAGTRNAYGHGVIMNLNLKGLEEKDLKAINDYIESLK